MNLTKQRLSFIVSATILLLAAIWYFGSKKPIDSQSDTIYYQGKVTINDTVRTASRQNVVILPGTEINFGPNGIIVTNGDVSIEGTETNPIHLTGSTERVSQRILQVRRGSKECTIKHTIVTNGMITSIADRNYMGKVVFNNNKRLKWNDAMARFWQGEILIEDCIVNGNNQGEGFLIHNMIKPVVRNCIFHKVPDAVEIIQSSDGEISGNIFNDCSDDAIDLNSCHRILIKNNQIHKVKDRGMEIGSQNYGSSTNISIVNNLVTDCLIGIGVKESSSVHITNTTFYNNKTALQVITPKDSTKISSSLVSSSVFSNNKQNLAIDARSSAKISSSISDTPLSPWECKVFENMAFTDPKRGDYTLIPTSAPDIEVSKVGYQGERY